MELLRVGVFEWFFHFYTLSVMFLTMGIGLISLVLDRVQMQSREYTKEATASLIIGILYLAGAPLTYLLLHLLN